MKNTSSKSQNTNSRAQVLALNIKKMDAKTAGVAAAALCFNKV